MYPSTSPEFQRIIREHIDSSAIQRIAPILPYSVIIANNSNESLIAVVVRTEMKAPGGRVTTADGMISSMTRHNMIRAGERILMTPISGLNTVLKPGKAPQLQGSQELDDVLAARSSEMDTMSDVQIILDSVIFSGGGLVGPDKTNNLGRMNVWRESERNLLQRTVAAVDHVQFLKSHAKPSSPPQAEVESHTRRTAQLAMLWAEHYKTREAFNSQVLEHLADTIPLVHRR